jgi:nitroreductase
MKDNYKAWDIDISEFHKLTNESEQLRFLLRFAVLAPSSHNSQPWFFEIQENTIRVFLEPSRRLLHSDKNDRQAYISLGCAITNIIIAADYYGLSPTVILLPDKQNSNLAAQISFTSRVTNFQAVQSSNHLIFSIPKRVTNRNKYESKLPPKSFLEEIKNFSTDDLQIYIVADQEQKNQLADIAISASVVAMEDKDFRHELSQYVKPNTTSSLLGMPCFGMGIPTPISFIASTMIKYLNMNKLSRKKDKDLLKKHTPIFVIIATRNDNQESWIKTGQLYENIALLATREGLSTAMWAAPIQIGEFYKDFQKVLSTDFRPQAFFRLGYAVKQTPHSPRLFASACSKHI